MERYLLEYETNGDGTMVEVYRPTLTAARRHARRLVDRGIAWPPEVRIWREQRDSQYEDWEHDRAFEPEDIGPR